MVIDIETRFSVGDKVWFYDPSEDDVKNGYVAIIHLPTYIDCDGYHTEIETYKITDYWEELSDDELFESEEDCKMCYDLN